jgi:hypothetical protein
MVGTSLRRWRFLGGLGHLGDFSRQGLPYYVAHGLAALRSRSLDGHVQGQGQQYANECGPGRFSHLDTSRAKKTPTTTGTERRRVGVEDTSGLTDLICSGIIVMNGYNLFGVSFSKHRLPRRQSRGGVFAF